MYLGVHWQSTSGQYDASIIVPAASAGREGGAPVTLVMPSCWQYLPPVQLRQSPRAVRPVSGRKVPAGQGTGAAEPAGQKWPAAHASPYGSPVGSATTAPEVQ